MRTVVITLALALQVGSVSAFELKGLSLGSPTSPTQVQSAMGVKCGRGAHEMQVCNGPTTIGGIFGDVNIVISASGKLQRIWFTFKSSSFESMAEAFTEKYGKPKMDKSTGQNAFGARFGQITMSWADSRSNWILLSKDTAILGTSTISMTSPEDRELLRKINKADRSDL